MKNPLLIVTVLAAMVCFFACSGSQEKQNGQEEEEEQAELIETEEQLVQHCKHLGTISELPDPGKIIQALENSSTRNRVLDRAEILGATHIVWINQNKDGYILNAYQCPESE